MTSLQLVLIFLAFIGGLVLGIALGMAGAATSMEGY